MSTTFTGIIEDESIEIAMQYGCSDAEKFRDHGINLTGFTHDTMQSEYLRWSDKKKYGLEEIVNNRFPEFAGYKTITYKELLAAIPEVPPRILTGTTTEQGNWLKNNGLLVAGAEKYTKPQKSPV